MVSGTDWSPLRKVENVRKNTVCGSKSSRLSHPSGAAAAIVLLDPPDLLRISASIVLLCVWKDWSGDWLPEHFGGDPTLLETMTHHDAASNSTTHALGLSQRSLGTIVKR
jgi:hypothetical protein